MRVFGALTALGTGGGKATLISTQKVWISYIIKHMTKPNGKNNLISLK
jgi:hypothetical protein